MLCVRCKKNMAVVFVTRMEPDGTQLNEGYCLSCAKELNIDAVNNMIKGLGITPEEFDSMNNETLQMMEGMLSGDIDPSEIFPEELIPDEAFNDSEDGGAVKKSPLSFLSGILGGNGGSGSAPDSSKSKEKSSDNLKKDKQKNKRKFFLEKLKIILFLSVSQGWEKPQLPRVWLSELQMVMSLQSFWDMRFIFWIWQLWLQELSSAVNLNHVLKA